MSGILDFGVMNVIFRQRVGYIQVSLLRDYIIGLLLLMVRIMRVWALGPYHPISNMSASGNLDSMQTALVEGCSCFSLFWLWVAGLA